MSLNWVAVAWGAHRSNRRTQTLKQVGHRNAASRLAADAWALFSRNLYNFLRAFWYAETKRPVLPDDDEIVQGVRLTRGGRVVNQRLLA